MSSSKQSKLPLGREHLECSACSKPGPPKRCSRCRIAFYCSVECQKAHWKNGHKEECKPCIAFKRTLNAKKKYNDPCYICLSESMVDPFTFPECGHTFCFGCIQQWQNASARNTNCPTCRNKGTNVIDSAVERGKMHASFATSNKNLTKDQQEKHWKIAHYEFEKIAFKNIVDIDQQVRFIFEKTIAFSQFRTPGQVFGTFSQIDRCCHEGAVVHKRQLREKKEALEKKDFQLAKIIGDQIESRIIAEGEPPKMGENIFEMYSIMAQMKEKMGDYKGAMCIYSYKLAFAMDEFDCYPRNNAAVHFYMGMSRCCYHLKDYRGAIEASEGAIGLNRAYPQVHKYLALSQKATGDLEAAIRTMGRAINLEADFGNRDINIKLYNELKSSLASK